MKIENTSERQYDMYALPKDGKPTACFTFPRATQPEGDTAKQNGTGDIPDDVLSELLAKDPWTKAVFDSGELVAMGSLRSDSPKVEAKK